MNNMESTSFIFEPINSECAAFMNLLPPGSQIGQAAIKNTNKIITKLDKAFISLFTKKDKTTKNPLKNIASQSPKVKYANNKIHILVNHIQKETENLKNNAQNLELQVICFLTQCKESNLSVAFQINEFMYHLKKNYKKNDYIIKAKKKINYLEKFIEFNIQRKTSIDLKIEIYKYTNNYRLDDEYFPINDFDYIIHQKYDHKIEAVVNQIIGDTPESIDSLNSIKNDSTSDSLIAYNSLDEHNETISSERIKSNSSEISFNYYDFSPLQILLAQILDEIKPNNYEQNILIKCSVVRAFFESLYIKNPSYLFKLDPSNFGHNCSMVQISTPKQVNIPEKIMKVEDMKIPLHILVHQNEHLQNAIDHFDLMQFFPNPIDIVAQIYLGMKKCEMFLTVNSIINKLTIPSKKSKDLASKEMSFDDFFPVYFSIVAVNPPPNSVQMKHFLDSIIGISIPVTFDYARLFFTSAVEYLEKYENNAPEEENIPLSKNCNSRELI